VRQVDALERAGLVQRLVNPDDERVRPLSLTENGRKHHPRVLDALRSVHSMATRGFDRQEERMLLSLLRRLDGNLET
jgi:DNA-binding MarR family transcriptional regulator